MNCPRDGLELSPTVEEGGVQVDNCPVCSGMWLQKGELEAILAAHRRTRAKAEPADDLVAGAYRVAKERSDKPLACPSCGTEMERREYAMTSQVLIDSCPAGCGIWVDAGEIGAIERFYDGEKAEADAQSVSFFHRLAILIGA